MQSQGYDILDSRPYENSLLRNTANKKPVKQSFRTIFTGIKIKYSLRYFAFTCVFALLPYTVGLPVFSHLPPWLHSLDEIVPVRLPVGVVSLCSFLRLNQNIRPAGTILRSGFRQIKEVDLPDFVAMEAVVG